MADTNKLDMPEKTTPPMPGGSPPAPATKEAASPIPDTIDDRLEPPTPFDIPNPSKVVSFDKTSDAGTDKSADDAKLQREQEALLKSLDEKADSIKDASKPKKAPAKSSKQKPAPAKKAAPPKEAPAPVEETPPVPREAPRPAEVEQVVFIPLTELHPFKNRPFGVRDDAEMKALVESVRAGGVNQPALVRPIEGGGYEIIAGHRRHKASELAGFTDMRCIVRNMTDEEAILAMTDDNLRHRSEILPSEKAVSLKMQVEAIKHQGMML